MGHAGIREAYETGRGRIVVRARAHSEPLKQGKTAIIVTELPYQVNKAQLIEKIAELVREKKISEISDLRDESDRSGMRVVIELKREAIPKVVLNKLFKHTAMQSTFGVIMLALADGVPQDPLAQARCSATTSPTRRKSSSGGPGSSWTRPRSGPTSWKACSSPSTTWTRSSASSARARTPKPPRWAS